MSELDQLGRVAYEEFRRQFSTGELSWDELDTVGGEKQNDPKAGAVVKAKWKAIAAKVIIESHNQP
jgi:hypothetical protein